MARSRNTKALKHQQQEVDQEVPVPKPAKRKIKRKNLLHGCKLCPEKCFPVSARSKIRPANPSVEGHVLKEHPGMEYTQLTRRWGHHLIYEDGSVERVPLIDHDDEQERELRVNANFSLANGFEVDPYLGLSREDRELYSALSKSQSTNLDNDAESSSRSTATHYDSFGMPVSIEPNSQNHQSGDWFSDEFSSRTDNVGHATANWKGNASSAFDDLPVLDLDEDQFRLRISNISPFNPNDPVDNHISTRIDPLLMTQGDMAHSSSPPDSSQHGAQYMLEIARDNETTYDNTPSLPDLTKVQKMSEHTIPVQHESNQVDGPGSSLNTTDYTFATFELMQKRIMEQNYRQLMSLENGIPIVGNHSFPQDLNLYETTLGDRGQSTKAVDDPSLSYDDWKAGASSSKLCYPKIPMQSHFPVSGVLVSQSALHTPPAASASPFKLPTTSTSVYDQAPKSDRSSRSSSKQNSSIKQVKTSIPSPQKRNASAPHPQTPTPKSRRSNGAAPTSTTLKSPLALRTQVLPLNPANPPRFTSNQPGALPRTLQYSSRGPSVFKFKFDQLHPLDQQALTGHQGEPVTTLSRFAFFGHSSDDAEFPRTREKQLIDMIAYLRAQRDALYSNVVNGQGNASVTGSDPYRDTNIGKHTAA